ncbi:hypothetical protein J0683_24560, partial [Vibrio parahaemolyticus]|uniref:hypothetical protein n=1 Tax=Vibrio parahaemolyticus TaxID=670 RepID=UPI001A8F2A38|nr:hypothetical protein [Vibrio parahaemolyticus]
MGEPHLRLKRDAPAGSSFDTVQPNPEFTEMLVGMGFPLELAQVRPRPPECSLLRYRLTLALSSLSAPLLVA